MRVVVATACIPFAPARERRLAAGLRDAIRARGHEADLVILPFRPGEDEEAQILGFRLLGLTESGGAPIDRLVTLRGPACIIPHPAKTAWVVEPHPGPAAPWPPNGPAGPRPAELAGLREARQVRPASLAGARRLREAHGLSVAPHLYPPPPDGAPAGPPEGSSFAVLGPMAAVGRHALVLEALRFTPPEIDLVFVGAGDHGPLASLAEEWGFAGRVRFAGVVALPSCVAAVTFGVAQMSPEEGVLEAFAAGRAVVAADDSGAAAELIEDGANGLLLPPDPRAIADALARLAHPGGPARAMGEAARRTLAARRITWAHVAEQLLT